MKCPLHPTYPGEFPPKPHHLQLQECECWRLYLTHILKNSQVTLEQLAWRVKQLERQRSGR